MLFRSSSSQHPNRRTRGLSPVTPSQGHSYTLGPSFSSQTFHMSHRRASQSEPPQLPPLPATSRAPTGPTSAHKSRTKSIYIHSLSVPPPLSTNRQYSRYSAVLILHRPTLGLPLRHYLTHLRYFRNHTPTSEVSPPSTSHIATTTHPSNSRQLIPRASTFF